MPHVRSLHPSQYLGAHDLNGKDVHLTILGVIMAPLKTDRGEEIKPLVRFEEVEKAAKAKNEKPRTLVLNRTNATTIASIHGNEVDDWTGKRITLFPTTVQAFGETKDCIRIRPTAPQETK